MSWCISWEYAIVLKWLLVRRGPAPLRFSIRCYVTARSFCISWRSWEHYLPLCLRSIRLDKWHFPGRPWCSEVRRGFFIISRAVFCPRTQGCTQDISWLSWWQWEWLSFWCRDCCWKCTSRLRCAVIGQVTLCKFSWWHKGPSRQCCCWHWLGPPLAYWWPSSRVKTSRGTAASTLNQQRITQVSDSLLDQRVCCDKVQALHLPEVGLLPRHVNKEQFGHIPRPQGLLMFLSFINNVPRMTLELPPFTSDTLPFIRRWFLCFLWLWWILEDEAFEI